LAFYLGVGIAIVSNVLYHIFQKVTPPGVHPLAALGVTYLTALVVCIALLPVFPLTGGILPSLRGVTWASVALGLAVVGLELGFLLAYRGGWIISLAALITNATVALLLLPVGWAVFRERLSGVNLIGAALSLVGLILVNWRG
jgi:drug/metabolite transporter (DMT)-like permease